MHRLRKRAYFMYVKNENTKETNMYCSNWKMRRHYVRGEVGGDTMIEIKQMLI